MEGRLKIPLSSPCDQDAEFLLKLEPPIEYICVSFVQKAQDLQADSATRLAIRESELREALTFHMTAARIGLFGADTPFKRL